MLAEVSESKGKIPHIYIHSYIISSQRNTLEKKKPTLLFTYHFEEKKVIKKYFSFQTRTTIIFSLSSLLFHSYYSNSLLSLSEDPPQMGDIQDWKGFFI
jgi:hypothetical protein